MKGNALHLLTPHTLRQGLRAHTAGATGSEVQFHPCPFPAIWSQHLTLGLPIYKVEEMIVSTDEPLA